MNIAELLALTRPMPRPRGPIWLQRIGEPPGDDGPIRVRVYEYRGEAWHWEAERPIRAGERWSWDAPRGVIVSRPAPGMRQVELSRRDNRSIVSADPEGYAR